MRVQVTSSPRETASLREAEQAEADAAMTSAPPGEAGPGGVTMILTAVLTGGVAGALAGFLI
jgi:hypothetical protein